LISSATLDVIIENEKIVQGIYRIDDKDEKYIYDLDISGDKENCILKDITRYLKKKSNHQNHFEFI
jgi:hypothetical protein